MTRRSQRGGANTLEERREVFGSVGKIASDPASENDEGRLKGFTLR